MVNRSAHALFSIALAFGVAHTLGVCAELWAENPVLERPVTAFRAVGQPAFDEILRFGSENHIALGIVLSEEICSVRFNKLDVGGTVQVVVEEFAGRLPSYDWRVADGVVVFAPKRIPEATAKFLALRPPHYIISEGSARAQSLYAWMDIKALLRPREGTAWNIVSSWRENKWPSLVVNDLSVGDLLNHLVDRKPAGAWFLVSFEDPDGAADHRPFELVNYSDEISAWPNSPCTGARRP